MIKQPERISRNVKGSFYESEAQMIDKLNQEFFQDVELTPEENRVLI